VYRIESATVVSADIACITAGLAPVDGSNYTADQRTFATHASAVWWSMIWERVGGVGGGRRM